MSSPVASTGGNHFPGALAGLLLMEDATGQDASGPLGHPDTQLAHVQASYSIHYVVLYMHWAPNFDGICKTVDYNFQYFCISFGIKQVM